MDNIGIFADTHLTKNMRGLQELWNKTARNSIIKMYDKFDAKQVESVICLGDFFDAPRLEAKHMNLVLPILEHINTRTYPTFILLGNHEADSTESNILDYLNQYENIIPVTELKIIENLVFLPYFIDLESVTFNIPIENKIVFTHHDFYGSELASGKTKAFFGADPTLLDSAKYVFNGHVHLASDVTHNLTNVGSLLPSAQGELRFGEFPEYLIITNLNSMDITIEKYKNLESIVYLTVEDSLIPKVLDVYPIEHTVLKIIYTENIPIVEHNFASVSYRKNIDNIDGISRTPVIKSTNFDMKSYLTDYITNDDLVRINDKNSYITRGLELLRHD